MELLVTKFSKGRYKNEGELFAEPISSHNVKLMGEMIALQSFRNVKKYDLEVADKLYIGLIKDLHHMNEVRYTVSDGYDYAQIAVCFLCQFMGRCVDEIYGKDKKGKDITIRTACYREVDLHLMRYRRKAQKTEYIAFEDYKALPADPADCFGKEEENYEKADALVKALNLSDLELAILECYVNGMVQGEVCAALGIGRGTIHHRKASIRKRYYARFGEI